MRGTTGRPEKDSQYAGPDDKRQNKEKDTTRSPLPRRTFREFYLSIPLSIPEINLPIPHPVEMPAKGRLRLFWSGFAELFHRSLIVRMG